MFTDYLKRLTHTAEYLTTSNGTPSPYGGTSVLGEANLVKCFAYWDQDVKYVDGTKNTLYEGWKILLPASMSGVQVNDRFQNVTDKNDQVIIDDASVNSVIVYSHPRDGIKLVECRLTLN